MKDSDLLKRAASAVPETSHSPLQQAGECRRVKAEERRRAKHSLCQL
jgi:hypothetical protein